MENSNQLYNSLERDVAAKNTEDFSGYYVILACTFFSFSLILVSKRFTYIHVAYNSVLKQQSVFNEKFGFFFF